MSYELETITQSSLPPLASSTSLLLATPLLPSLNAFGALVQVTIEKTVPSTSVLTVISPPLDILKPLVCLPNATFAVDGDIATDFALPGLVTYAIEEVMSLMIVQLTFFPLSRLPIILGVPLTLDESSPCSFNRTWGSIVQGG